MICKRATLAPPARVFAMYSTPLFVGLGCSVHDLLEPEIYIHKYFFAYLYVFLQQTKRAQSRRSMTDCGSIIASMLLCGGSQASSMWERMVPVDWIVKWACQIHTRGTHRVVLHYLFEVQLI